MPEKEIPATTSVGHGGTELGQQSSFERLYLQLRDTPIPAAVEPSAALAELQRMSTLFEGFAPYESHINDALLNLQPNDSVVIFGLMCDNPGQQKINPLNGTGGTAIFMRDFKAAFYPKKKFIVKDSHACQATAAKPECPEVWEPERRAFVKKHVHHAWNMTLMAIAAASAKLEDVFVGGRATNRYFDTTKDLLPAETRYNPDLVHPGMMRRLANASPSGQTTALQYAYAVTPHVDEVDTYLSTLFKMSLFRKFGKSSAKAISAVKDAGSKATWLKEVKKAAPADQAVLAQYIVQDRPYLGTLGAVAQAALRGLIEGKLRGVRDFAGHPMPGWSKEDKEDMDYPFFARILRVAKHPLGKSLANKGHLSSERLGNLAYTSIAFIAYEQYAQYASTCEHSQFLPPLRPIYSLTDLYEGSITNLNAFVQENGAPYLTQCNGCQKERISTKWVYAFPVHHKCSKGSGEVGSYCGTYFPVDPNVAKLSLYEDMIQEHVRRVLRFQKYDSEAETTL